MNFFLSPVPTPSLMFPEELTAPRDLTDAPMMSTPSSSPIVVSPIHRSMNIAQTCGGLLERAV